MRLARWNDDGTPRCAVAAGARWYDLPALIGAEPAALGASTGTLVEVLAAAREALAGGAPDRSAELDGARVESALLAPLWGEITIYCASLNYHSHIKETGLQQPARPHFFLKPTRCVIGPGEAVELPRVSQKPDYEAELAVVIGRRGKYVSVDDALELVAGYTIVDDISFRDLQLPPDMPGVADWIPGKGLDTAAPAGPWIVSADALPGVHDASLRLWIGDDLRQDGRTSDMVFGVARLISALSQGITLEPGDVIATGTCSGVGSRSGRFLADGDEVRIEIEQLGELRHLVRTEG